MLPLIGITTGEVHNKQYPWQPVTYGQTHYYSDAVIRAGGAPLLIPLTDDKKVLRTLYDSLQGILMAGGNDIDPTLYGEAAGEHLGFVSKLRDQAEAQLVQWAMEDNKPILAICRGMQMLNVANGGTLQQHLPDVSTELNHMLSTELKDVEHVAHQLRISPSTKLAATLGVEAIAVNSHHHQGVAKLAPNLTASAWAEDNLIEGIESQTHPFAVGVQCHPESLEVKTVPEWQKLFVAFVSACK